MKFFRLRWGGSTLVSLLILLAGVAQAATESGSRSANTAQYRQWILEMKEAPRGPFTQIRWFCKDGTVHPARPYPCGDRGGGVQHGEWSDRTEALRAQGYSIANVLAGSNVGKLISAPDFLNTYTQLLVEKFLIAADDGWIFRQAQFYRGAIQEEDERETARDLLTAMAARPGWFESRYAALRVGVRLLPHGEDTASVLKVRQLAATLAERDKDFTPLRVKIHGTPEVADAARVREYARTSGAADLRPRYDELAAEIDRVYSPQPLGDVLEANAQFFSGGPWLQQLLRQARAEYIGDPGAANRYQATATLLAQLRDSLPRIRAAAARLRVMDLSLAVEAEHFRAGAELRRLASQTTRHAMVALLRAGAEAAYGTGMVNGRQRQELARTFARLDADTLSLKEYLHELHYLGLVPGWATQGLRFYFFEAMEKLKDLEPLAELFIQDQLRGSPLLAYSQLLDGLTRDANQLAGIAHKIFGQDVGIGFNALNPGLARGVLYTNPDMTRVADFQANGIYLLPETVADLPPVSGILTSGAGNPLSHVQLLARNLGIPNVAVDEALLAMLRQHDGQRVVLAVSPAGLVELAADDSRWQGVFGANTTQASDVIIKPDLAKLDLSVVDFVPLSQLRATDSGRIVGPKAAKLGELSYHFPEAVAPGVAIPFGLFRRTVLDRPYRNGALTVYEWMVSEFRQLEALPADSPQQQQFAERFRSELYDLIRNTTLGAAFRDKLRAAMAAVFGPDFKGGVFIRSDTNVEDLPGFTGAGLNLTLPHLVGFNAIFKGLPEVWASPYTARAFAWRQKHMKDPEHVYPAVLLLQTVPAEKSGVMVTQDVETGDRNILSVAVNEGVGGAVEGQAAESLRIDSRDGSVRVLATATAPWRRVPQPTGGVAKLPATGSETLLQAAEIRQLITFAQEIPSRFPPIVDGDGKPAAADVEFAFVDGKLWLLQIRPFNESRQARSSAYLAQMDAALAHNLDRIVNLREVLR